MIQRFSTLYVGHIELDQCGLSGTPADDRRYPNARLIETFDTAAELARTCDTLGYETLWLAEHHFQHEGYECIPNIPLLAVDLAQYFSRDELVLLRLPAPVRAVIYVAGAYVFILAGRFESNAFIYFQF